MVLALDVVELLLTGVCNVAIIVSLDRDLFEIPAMIANVKRLLPGPVRLEAAVPVPDALPSPKTIARFSYTHQLTRNVFDLVRDDVDYTVADEEWTPPTLPRTLAEVTEKAP